MNPTSEARLLAEAAAKHATESCVRIRASAIASATVSIPRPLLTRLMRATRDEELVTVAKELQRCMEAQ